MARPTQPRVEAITLRRGSAPAAAGPDALGRNIIVAGNSPVPEPWREATRLLIDDSAVRQPAAAIDQLRRAAATRQRLVIELAVDFEKEPASVERRAPHELSPSFAFELDEL